MSMIAVSGLDMAAWDAPARTAEVPLAVLLGGSLAPVSAYNSNGLWLTPVNELGEQAAALLAEGEFQGLKLRLGRERLADDIAAIRAVRDAVGEDVSRWWTSTRASASAMRCTAATPSTIRVFIGWKSLSRTTISRVIRGSRASSRP